LIERLLNGGKLILQSASVSGRRAEEVQVQ